MLVRLKKHLITGGQFIRAGLVEAELVPPELLSNKSVVEETGDEPDPPPRRIMVHKESEGKGSHLTRKSK